MISGKTLLLLGVTAVASTASANGQMVGGNGLCASPGSLGPNAPMGAYQPVTSAEQEGMAEEVAIDGTRTYLNNWRMQSDLDNLIVRTCRPPTFKVVRTVEVEAACSQVVAGTNYKVKSTFEVPCSRAAASRLPAGTSLVRTIITEAYESLQGDVKVNNVYADDSSNGLLQSSGKSSGNRKMMQSPEDDIYGIEDIEAEWIEDDEENEDDPEWKEENDDPEWKEDNE